MQCNPCLSIYKDTVQVSQHHKQLAWKLRPVSFSASFLYYQDCAYNKTDIDAIGLQAPVKECNKVCQCWVEGLFRSVSSFK